MKVYHIRHVWHVQSSGFHSLKKKKKKLYLSEARQVFQWLRALTAFQLYPYTHIRWLTTAYTVSPALGNPIRSSGLRGNPQTCGTQINPIHVK